MWLLFFFENSIAKQQQNYVQEHQCDIQANAHIVNNTKFLLRCLWHPKCKLHQDKIQDHGLLETKMHLVN